MQTVAILASAIELARQLGYTVREDHLDGAGGGHCLIRGQKWLLLDITQPHSEQLSDVIDALRSEPNLPDSMPPALASLLAPARAAA